MKIGITGATGHLGRLVVAKMKERAAADDLVALVRSPQKAADLGIEAREADYDKPETLQRALQGIDTLLLISGSEVGKRARQHQHIIDAARQNGVQRIVYTSVLHADNTSVSLATEHRATEQALKDSGIPHTFLRNGWYTENYTASIPGALAGGAVIGSAGEGKISAATREDYADAAVAVLTSEGHEGKVYELAGDEAFTLKEYAAELSRQTGRDIPYKNLPEAEYAAAMAGFGIPEEMARAIAGWDVSVSKGDLFDDSRQLSKLIGRPTTPLSVAIEEALQYTSKAG
ncbi:SDR family oxidoreductase [Pontibacter amylolyticus]|uniref:NAD(P)-dependent oxidoreductase n=1 Tax=Pontibacter amylolyticus TaxID=1424080 RepID=A0ABQ1VXF9_9BACT|nr:SDR family oxidoreductase [Pontibacter amylolyticus]GGG02917.1 NAD(P)-dependent oxidoreductase [Pontibacter amylolyticus]